MRQRAFYLILVILVVVGVLVAVFAGREREPEYGGKRLSEWVDQYGDASKSVQKEAYEATRRIGTNAIPYLLMWIRYEPPAWRGRVNTQRLLRNSVGVLLGDDPREIRANLAMHALVVVASQSQGPAEELGRLMNDPKHGAAARRAEHVLASMGKSGLPAFVAGLTNTEADVRLRCAEHIFTLGADTHEMLLKLQSDPDWRLRALATNAPLMFGIPRAPRRRVPPQPLESATPK